MASLEDNHNYYTPRELPMTQLEMPRGTAPWIIVRHTGIGSRSRNTSVYYLISEILPGLGDVCGSGKAVVTSDLNATFLSGPKEHRGALVKHTKHYKVVN